MCIYCRNRGNKRLIITKHNKHSNIDGSNTGSQSSFSSIQSSQSSELCERHKYTVTHRTNFNQRPVYQKYHSPHVNTFYKTTKIVSPQKYSKVTVPLANHPQSKSNNQNQVQTLNMKRFLQEKQRRIQNLMKQNMILKNEIKDLKQNQHDELQKLIHQLKNKQIQKKDVQQQNKKIKHLLSELQTLRNQHNELNQANKQVFRMKSLSNYCQPTQRQKVIIVQQKSQKVQKGGVKQDIIIEEKYTKWKNNFIYAFIDFIDKLMNNKGQRPQDSVDLKKRTKIAWRDFKQYFHNN